jgi:hypothetical protein
MFNAGRRLLVTLAAGNERCYCFPFPESGWEAFRSVHRDRGIGIQQHIKLLNPQPRVDRVLEMVGLKQYVEVFTDLDTALASF